MTKDKWMSHEDTIENEKAENPHSDEVLAGFEEELRLLEKWLDEPKVYADFIECKKEFQIETKLNGSLLEEKKNAKIGKQDSHGKEKRIQPSK